MGHAGDMAPCSSAVYNLIINAESLRRASRTVLLLGESRLRMPLRRALKLRRLSTMNYRDGRIIASHGVESHIESLWSCRLLMVCSSFEIFPALGSSDILYILWRMRAIARR